MILKSGHKEGERLAEVEQKERASPEMEALNEWLRARTRSVQEVSVQLARLEKDEQAWVVDSLESSELYDTHFMLRLNARIGRESQQGIGSSGDQIRYLRDAPESMQRVVKTIELQRLVGRNLVALTPDRLPESLMYIWPPQCQLPELVLINLDRQIPQVTVVRRLPSAGGMTMERSEANAMTSLVRQVLGHGPHLASLCEQLGLEVEEMPPRIDVNLAEVSWSPHLELGEYLYDYEPSIGALNSGQSAKSRVELSGRQLMHQEDVLIDLQSRLQTLDEHWQVESGSEASQARERTQLLRQQWQQQWARSEALMDGRRQLQGELSGPSEGVAQEKELAERLSNFENDIETLREQSLEISGAVAQEERLCESFHQAQEVEIERAHNEEEIDPDESGDNPLRERSKAERHGGDKA